MKDIVIAGAFRTPLTNLGGAFRNLTNQELGAALVKKILDRTRLDPRGIDSVVFGCVGQQSDAPNVARVISLMAGLPVTVPAFTVNRNCASGLQAVVSAAQQVMTGEAGLVIAGGVEVMSSSPFVNRDLRFGKKLRDSRMIDSLWEGLRDPVSGQLMGETAETLAHEYGISRKEQDRFALESHGKACQAVRDGKFRDEIVPVEVPHSHLSRERSPVTVVDQDEGPRPGLDPTAMEQLPPVFKEKGTVTVGNSCPISDGAAAVLVTTREKAEALGLDIQGVLKSWAFTGIEPRRMGLGPVDAAKLALDRAGLELRDLRLIELNEAFAAQYLAVERLLKLDRETVNVNGGALALGHPVGATGARLIVTLLHEMKRRKVSRGLAALCVGGGQGGAVILERSGT